MEGIYFLLLELKEPIEKRVGALGDIEFKEGRYIYVGSAQNSVEGRVSRHLRSEKSKHWHIDYLLENARIEEVLAFEMDRETECDSARALGKRFVEIEGFGSSDCNCDSHLFFAQKGLEELIEDISTTVGEKEIRSKDLDLQ
ncbi:MAG: GIY-YIG nuclease family protein [Candidatus Thermoplasmatota archaeon]|nr:GIY-YIG nuclease family protein [Candidatus Thermoplasmatota archaeon]